jgi:hypothetical protein
MDLIPKILKVSYFRQGVSLDEGRPEITKMHPIEA